MARLEDAAAIVPLSRSNLSEDHRVWPQREAAVHPPREAHQVFEMSLGALSRPRSSTVLSDSSCALQLLVADSRAFLAAGESRRCVACEAQRVFIFPRNLIALGLLRLSCVSLRFAAHVLCLGGCFRLDLTLLIRGFSERCICSAF